MASAYFVAARQRRRPVRLAWLTLAVALLTLSVCRPVAAQGDYWITDFDSVDHLFGENFLLGINNAGQVVSDKFAAIDAFLWLPAPAYGLSAGWNDLGALPGATIADLTEVTDINENGQVVGANYIRFYNAFLWLPSPAYGLPSGMNNLGTLGGFQSFAFSINDKGQIVGHSNIASGDSHAFLWLPSPAYGLPKGMNDLGKLPGGTGSEAWGINDKGQIVGDADTASGPGHAFLWLPSPAYGLPKGMNDLGTLPGGDSSEAVGINDKGQIVGRSNNASGSFDFHACLWQNGTWTDLGLTEFDTGAIINDAGQMLLDYELLTPIVFPSPTHGGNGPQSGEVTVRLTYGNTDSVASVILSDPNGAGDIPAENLTRQSAFAFLATFDLRGRSPGTRDVVLNLNDNTKVTMPKPFLVDSGGEPQVTADLVGGYQTQVNGVLQDFLRGGHETTYQLVVSNTGSVDAVAVPVWLALSDLPQGTQVSIQDFGLSPPPAVSGLAANWYQDYSPLASHSTQQFVPLLIPRLPAGSTRTLPLRLKVPGDTPVNTSFTLQVWPNPLYHQVFRDAVSPDVKECVKELAAQVYQNASGQNPDDAAFATAANTVVSQIQALVQNAYDNTSENGALTSLTLLVEETVLLTPQGHSLSPTTLRNAVGLTFSQPVSLDCFTQEALRLLTPTVVGSIDPNHLAGPLTFVDADGNAFVAGGEPMKYCVSFGNKSNATASAYDVVIEDGLDANNLDLTALNLDSINLEYPTGQSDVPFGLLNAPPGEWVSPLTGSREFSATLNLPTGLPAPNDTVAVSVHASVDLDTGKFVLRFHTDNPIGFLAPGAGGTVTFDIPWKVGILSGSKTSNQASIVFDEDTDHPLLTDQLGYVLDNAPPTSKVAALAATRTSLNFTVRWSGTDVIGGVKGCGVRDYTVSYQDNGGPWTTWMSHTTLTQATFVGHAGHTYAFVCSARDNVFNQEPMHAQADTKTTLTASVSGVVTLRGCVAAHQDQTLTFAFRPIDGSQALTRSVTLASDGSFALGDVPGGSYAVAVKGDRWLQKVVSVDSREGDVSGVAVTLLPGDINGDNSVDGADFELLAEAYQSAPGTSSWNPRADLNCDGRVNIFDLGLMADGYGKTGDP
jgi:probable HAF family extracellular repeat protein